MTPSSGDNAVVGPCPARPGPPGRRELALVGALLLAIAVAYLVSVPGVLLLNPDTAVYMGLGRSLARGDGYTFNFKPYAKYPPVFPAMVSAVFLAAGEHIWLLQAMVALCGVGALLAAYGLVRGRAGPGAAAGVVVLSALSSWFWAHASVYLRADVPYAFVSLLALWAAERQLRAPRLSWMRWAGVAALVVVALYTHMVGVALVAGISLGALCARAAGRPAWRRLAAAAMVGVAGLAATGYWLYRGRDISNPMANYGKHASVLPRGQMGSEASAADRAALRLQEWLRTPLNMDDEKATRGLALVACAVLLVPGLAVGFGRWRSGAEFYLCAYFAVSTFAGGPTGGARYVVPVVPLLFYYGYESLRVLGGAVGAAFGPRGRRVVPRVVLGVAVVMIASYGVYVRAKGKRGASKFEAERRERDRNRNTTWRAAAARVRREMAEVDAPLVYPGSGNTWAKLHYFADVPVAEVRFDHVGARALRAMAEQGADFVLDDVENEHCRRRLGPLLRDYPRCFRQVEEFREGETRLVLYRIDRAELEAALRELEEAGPPEPREGA
ncbi:MAG: ArnT family glycosyltransferase [Candidatus Brocadiia bacterium]